jgi:MSHA pilin protein MshD
MSETAMTRHKAVAGFTLVEMVVTIVILAIALVGVSGMISLGTSNSGDPLVQTRAIALGHSYLDEIMGRRFDERSAASGLDPCYDFSGPDRCTEQILPGPLPQGCESVLGRDGGEPSGNREKYDDVDDYNGLAEGDGLAGSPIRDAEGDTRPEYENYHVAVSVRYAGDDAVFGGLHCTNAKLITVTVTTRDQSEGWKFSAYKGNY